MERDEDAEVELEALRVAMFASLHDILDDYFWQHEPFSLSVWPGGQGKCCPALVFASFVPPITLFLRSLDMTRAPGDGQERLSLT